MDLSYHTRNADIASRARARIRRQGCNPQGQKLWTPEEDAILIEHKGDYIRLQKFLRHRTKIAIMGRCQKLGLRKKIHIWTGAELAILRRLYRHSPVKEIEDAFPHSTWVNICQVARYHGFRRKPRAPYKLTGHPALDEIRRRCFAIRWTMSDLDKAAKTGKYFQKSRWIGRSYVNHRAIGRAIEALDGVVQPHWKE